jgi:2-C-methyl-D-erythritol 4-phosphate cytidylyltransferase
MNIAIIPAAGSGKRLGGPTPKQFLAIAGQPILAHTLQRFLDCPDIGAIVVALPAEFVAEFQARDAQRGHHKPILYVSGGAERSDSILNALHAVADLNPEIIAVHDAVRPFVTPAQISAVIAKARATGAAILALPAVDTIKEVADGLIVRTIERSRIYHAQTPQAFRYDVLLQANAAARAAGIASATATDDAFLGRAARHSRRHRRRLAQQSQNHDACRFNHR